MATEHERKFLVSGDGWRPAVHDQRYIRQGYLGGDRCSVRVRLEDDAANLNIKVRRIGRSRAEYEYPIPLEDAREMLGVLCSGALGEKTRHLVHYGNLLWEVDEFHGDNGGLVVAEVELDDPERPIEVPEWAGREVTHEERYYNVNLSRCPYGEWRSNESGK